jgi:hypothetical protein
MAYYIYDKSTTAIVDNVRHRPYRVTRSYKTVAAAKAGLTRMSNKYWKDSVANNDYNIDKDPRFIYGIAEAEYYRTNIQKLVERVNFMTGKKYLESVNTPYHCSPSSETYWSS